MPTDTQMKVLFTDETIIPVHIDPGSAFTLVSALQVAWRHPELSEHMADRIQEIARLFQGRVVELYPELELFIEAGWYEEFGDVQIGEE